MNHLTWHPSKKVAFRFFFILFVLLIFLNNNGAFIFVDQLLYYPTLGLHRLIPWFSANILNYQYDFTIFPYGSGDTSYNYVLLLLQTLVSLFGAAIWSVLDSRRENYDKLYYWLLVLVRYYLGFTLFLYGMIKVIQLQFSPPSLSRLLQPLGDASPMGLAWTFLGFSNGYNMFMGIVEVLAILLLFRRTMVLGALLSLAASAHVMSMNYFFDVPVKILSTTLVAMSLFILAPYLLAIGRFLLFEEPKKLIPLQAPLFKKKWQLITFRVFKYLAIVWTVSLVIYNSYSSQYIYGLSAPKPPLYGIYNVEKYSVNGKEYPPLTTDKTRWKQMILQWKDFAQVKNMADSTTYFNIKLDQKTKTIEMASTGAVIQKYNFKYDVVRDSTLILSGLREKDSVKVIFKKYNLKNFRLINRGFHWINEYPYNR